MKVENCRICKSKIISVLSLGKFPAVNYYLSLEELAKKEKKYPLNFCICENCGLGQIDTIVNADKLFSTYHYISSTSMPLKEHLQSLAKICKAKFELNDKSRVLDIGCNDGTMLSFLKKEGVNVLGVDPAKNIMEQTKKEGIEVVSDFFTEKLSRNILKNKGSFDLITATNTLAQIIDLHDFVKGVKNLLSRNGSFVMEVGYLPKMISKKTFDSIYHEHYSYFSLTSLEHLFMSNDLEIYDAQEIDNHGGSIRVFVKNRDSVKVKAKRLLNILKKEKDMKINKAKAYENFVFSALKFKKDFRNMLVSLRKENKTIIGIGAPAKSVILLNFTGIDHTVISYITDSTSYKQNRFMPGVHIPITSEDKLKSDNSVDYFVLLAWTYKDAIMKKIKNLKKPNAKIIVPFPRLKIL